MEVQVGRNLAFFQRERGLDQSRDSSGRFQMSEIGLNRPQSARLRTPPDYLGESLDFDWVAEGGPGAMGFHILDIAWIGMRIGERGADHCLLRWPVRSREARGPSVLTGGATADHSPHAISCGKCVGEAL